MANMLTSGDLFNAKNAYPVGLMKFTLVGTTANTNIAVTGIATEDRIIECRRLNRDAATVGTIDMDDLTAETVILSAGNIQLTTTNTTGDKLMLQWYDKNPA